MVMTNDTIDLLPLTAQELADQMVGLPVTAYWHPDLRMRVGTVVASRVNDCGVIAEVDELC